MSQDILRIGRVIEVHGSKAIGELEATVNDLYRTYKSRRYAVGQIGSIVKIEAGDIYVFGIITSLRMVEDDELLGSSIRAESSKWIEIDLLGQGHRTGLDEDEFEFERGISTYPLPGQGVYLATTDELRRIYAKPEKPTVKVGRVAQARGLPVYLLVDELMGRHFAVLGTTGSGKSCAVTLLLHGVLEQYPYSHVVLLDPHNEYHTAFQEKAEVIDPTNLEIPHWLLNFEESIDLFIGRTEYQATSQTNILKEALLSARKSFPEKAISEEKITVDTPVPYRIGDLYDYIQKLAKELSASKSESHQKIMRKIETLRDDKRFEFLIRPDKEVEDNLAVLLSNFMRIPTRNKPLTIIDLSGVPSDVVNVVVAVLCRSIFDFTLWNSKRRQMPLLLVCEEAHRYMPKSEDVAFQNTRIALSRIAKEGRKYGVGLALISQRPSELSDSILSQCNTIVALRMSNEQDQNFVKRTLPDSIKSLVDTLPALRTREALVVGEGSSIPVRMLFDEIPTDRRPRSSGVPFAEAWSIDAGQIEDVKHAVKRWREQDRS